MALPLPQRGARWQSAHILSVLVLALMAAASAGGIFLRGLYRDNLQVASGWLGNDLVTLLIAVPALAASLALTVRGSSRGTLLWLGMLDYTLYNFAFYLFGSAFNRFFLLYAALFGLCLYALVFGMARLDVAEIGRSFSGRTPARWVSGFMALTGLGLAAVEISMAAGFVLGGRLPPTVIATGHPTAVVFALDLTLVIPALLLGAVWLWMRRPWGYVLAVVVNVKGAVYLLALSATTWTVHRAGIPGAIAELPIWLALGAGSLAAVVVLLVPWSTRRSVPQGARRRR